jgi:ABC-type sugar transport system permease subunit
MLQSRKPNHEYYGYLFIVLLVIAFLIFGLYPVYNTLALSLRIPP